MTLHHPFILTVLQRVSTDRLQKAVNALVEGSMTITLTRQTETEIRALVQTHAGQQYGMALTGAGVFCSCPDSLYRGSVCKHATTLALAVLRGEIKEAKNTRTIHLAMQEGMTLCGVQDPSHVWQWPYWPETAWKESCPECEAIRRQPALARTAA
jgi:hypothetical protein